MKNGNQNNSNLDDVLARHDAMCLAGEAGTLRELYSDEELLEVARLVSGIIGNDDYYNGMLAALTPSEDE